MSTPPGWYPDPAGDQAQQRYFDGTDWSHTWRPATLALSEAERSARLDTALVEAVRYGWRVEARSATQAVLATGSGVSGGVHVIHFLVTLLTCGLWAFVWILHAATQRVKRSTLTVDAYGNVVWSR